MKTLLAFAATVALATPVQAQYYEDRPPPPGYYPAPRYDEGPPRYYEPPRVRFGRACEAFLPPEYGSRRIVCPIVRAKPLGEECACPPPPGYPPGPYFGGRTVR